METKQIEDNVSVELVEYIPSTQEKVSKVLLDIDEKKYNLDKSKEAVEEVLKILEMYQNIFDLKRLSDIHNVLTEKLQDLTQLLENYDYDREYKQLLLEHHVTEQDILEAQAEERNELMGWK